MRKVFGIGLNKTATKSITAACEQLGFRSVHDSCLIARVLVSNRLRGGRPLESLEHYDAFFDLGFWTTDIPYPELLHELDVAYPGSRFILHSRSVDGWIESRREHRQRGNVRSVLRRLFTGKRPRPTGPDWEASARERYAECHRVALDYFRERPGDLLVFDATRGHGWPELCAFLERPVPTDARDRPVAFPHRGRRGERPLYQRWYYPLLARLRALENRLGGR